MIAGSRRAVRASHRSRRGCRSGLQRCNCQHACCGHSQPQECAGGLPSQNCCSLSADHEPSESAMFSDERHRRRVQNPTRVSLVSLRSQCLVARPSGGNRNLGRRACTLPVSLPCTVCWRGHAVGAGMEGTPNLLALLIRLSCLSAFCMHRPIPRRTRNDVEHAAM
jgi:hypothetical protein